MQNRYVTMQGHETVHNTLMFFRKEIDIDKSQSVNIKIHACNFYQLFIGGELLGRGNAPTNCEAAYYDEYNFIAPKSFCIVVKVYYIGKNIPHVPQQNQGVMALNLEVKTANGIIFADQSFKATLAPDYFRDELIDTYGKRISLWGGYKELYDDNLAFKGFMQIGFNDSAWQSATPLSKCFNEYESILKRPIKMLLEYDYTDYSILQIDNNLGSAEIMEDNTIQFDCSKAGSFPSVVLDFKQEVVGYISIVASAEKNSNMTVAYGESLDMIRLDSFIFGNDEGVLQPFGRRAFRYLKITFNGSALPAVLKKVSLKMTHYPLPSAKQLFKDELFQMVYDTSIHTAKLAMQHHYEDSIFREQALWLLDARIMAQVNYACFKEPNYVKETINKFIATQRADGSICAAGPQKTDQLLPDFCLHFVLMVKEWVVIGGGSPDDKVKKSLEKLFAWLSDNEDKNGLLTVKNKANWWCFIDWAEIDKRDIVTALNCLYYESLIAYAAILGNGDNKTAMILSKAKKAKDFINSNLRNLDRVYCDCMEGGIKSLRSSQQTNIYAIICGVCDNPDELIETIFNSEFNQTKINGAFMMCLTADMLFKHGKTDRARQLVDNYWGEMLRRGATTWWETFDMSTSKASIPYYLSKNNATYKHEYIPVSHCHAWGAGIAATLIKYAEHELAPIVRRIK